jgi:crotonobetainyl-CoA:carnitine CoA-transferase CaiB-like acyl-CoA transferase
MSSENPAGPLVGIKVLDFSSFIAGCYAAVMLGDLGAEIIKVEPKYGDGSRQWGPFLKGESRFFQAWNRNKRSIALDITSPEGLEIVHKLIAETDILVENYRPGITKKLGIDYPAAKALNPKLIYCSITGYGTKGPFGDRPAYDPLLQSMSGGAIGNDRFAGTTCISSVAFADYGAALLASNGILAALFHRERTGTGQRIETSLLQSAMTMQAHFYVKARDVEEEPPFGIYPYRLFETSDSLIFIAGPTDKFWKILCEAIGAPELGADPKYKTNPDRVDHADELTEALQPYFLTQTAEEWEILLVSKGFPCAAVKTYEEFFDLPQVAEMDMRSETTHDTIGPIDLSGVPLHFSATPGALQSAAPTLGQHTHQILTELNLTPEAIQKLQTSEII